MASTTDLDTYRETRMVALDDLHEFPGNAQVGDVDAIAESIRDTGQYRALIVRDAPDGRLVIMAGNHTWKALRQEGRTEARCEIHVCDDRTALKINVKDNRLAAAGHTDTDKLIGQLVELDGDYTGTGYDQAFLDRVTAAAADPEPVGPAPGSADLLEPPDEDRYAQQYGVIVTCADAGDQQDVYEYLRGQGYNCKIVTV